MTLKSASWNGEAEHSWAAGAWSATLRGDEVADVTFGGVPVMRALRFIVRDRDWRTPPATVEEVVETEAGVQLHIRCRLDEIDVSALLILEAEGDTLAFTATATANSAFWTARTGLVAHQPPSLAGTPLRVQHADGSSSNTQFPDRVQPHQPVVDIQGLSWEAGGVAVTATFSGDVFEIEDQRNWTDASYKAYTPPLDRPSPVLTETGQSWTHGVRIHVDSARDTPRSDARDSEATVAVPLQHVHRSAPSLGTGASTAPDHGGPRQAPPVDFIVVELLADSPNWLPALERAASSGLPLDVRIVTDHPSRVRTVVQALEDIPLIRLGVFAETTHVTERALWNALKAASRHLEAQLVGGARSHYTELNRTRHRLPEFDSYTFSITPQMHVHETSQIIESLGIQRLVTRDAVEAAAGAQIHVGPVTLRPRLNAVATTPRSPERPDLQVGYGPALVPGATDPRQAAEEVGAWTIASAAALAAEGAASVTFYEEWGPRGITSEAGKPLSAHGALAALHALAGGALIIPETVPSQTSGIHILGAVTATETTILVANLSSESRTVVVTLNDESSRATVPAGAWKAIHLSQ